MYYPIGNTKSFSVFHAFPGDVFEALFLGCGDVRNVLATARHASTYRSLKQLTVHINDNTRQIIARAALLLLLANELDIRLWPAVGHEFGTREEAVRGVWRGWIRLAAGAAPSPAAIRREREAWVVTHVANKPGSRVTTAEAAAESLAITTLARFKSFMTSDGVDGFQPYQAEVNAWHVSGAAHFGFSRVDRKVEWVTNPTLLHPETGAWEVHYAASPYACFFPLDQGEDLSRNLRDPLKVAKVCMRDLTELVAGFQACATRVKISVQLWLMDAISCCDWGLPVDQLFDSVDTSNLADNVELLNLLLMAGPRLKKTPPLQAICTNNDMEGVPTLLPGLQPGCPSRDDARNVWTAAADRSDPRHPHLPISSTPGVGSCPRIHHCTAHVIRGGGELRAATRVAGIFDPS
ncbi:g5942 [Coccomyxa elongata]